MQLTISLHWVCIDMHLIMHTFMHMANVNCLTSLPARQACSHAMPSPCSGRFWWGHSTRRHTRLPAPLCAQHEPYHKASVGPASGPATVTDLSKEATLEAGIYTKQQRKMPSCTAITLAALKIGSTAALGILTVCTPGLPRACQDGPAAAGTQINSQ